MLKMKLQYFGHLMWRADSLEKTLMLGKIEGRKRKGQHGWMPSLTWRTWVWASSGWQWRTGKSDALQSLGSQSRTWLSNWTTTKASGLLDIWGFFLLYFFKCCFYLAALSLIYGTLDLWSSLGQAGSSSRTRPPTLGAWSPSQWTTRKVPIGHFRKKPWT